MRAAAVVAAMGLVVGWPAAPARARSRAAVALRYEAPPGCPDRAAYVARIAVHGGAVELIGAPEATGGGFVVRIDERGGRFLGAVTIAADRDQPPRVIEAADCGELVDALALFTVLALDPSTADEPVPAPLGSCVVTFVDAVTVTATFSRLTCLLTVERTGTGTGLVRSTPAGIDCGADCTEDYVCGTIAILTALPASGSHFVGWTTICTGTGACAVSMTAPMTVTAHFSSN